MNNLMIDLETMGKKPNAPVVAIWQKLIPATSTKI